MSGGAKTFSIEMDTSGLDAYLNELGDDVEAAVRPAAQAGTQVLYEAVQANVARLGRYTGNLASSIYQKFSEEQSSDGVAVYNVSWNARKAPHGHLVESGYLQRYVYGPDGMGPLVRPGMEGKPRPKSGGRNRAALDAYYITLPTPKHVPGKFFVRKASTAMGKAYEAAEAELLQRIQGKNQ